MRHLPIAINWIKQRWIQQPTFSGLLCKRNLATLEQTAVEQSLGPDPSRLEIKLSTLPGPSDKIKNGEVRWGTIFTNHMFEAEWRLEEGWSVPKIVPRHAIELHPAASVLHYGLEVFEGLKAHRGTKDGKVVRNTCVHCRLFKSIG